jgi:hypothetical protein
VSLAIASLLGTPAAHLLRTAGGHAPRRTDVAPGLEVSVRNALLDLLVQQHGDLSFFAGLWEGWAGPRVTTGP